MKYKVKTKSFDIVVEAENKEDAKEKAKEKLLEKSDLVKSVDVIEEAKTEKPKQKEDSLDKLREMM